MYRSCIFCSADLRANEALERFPVGRSIAFDAEKGRLWAVCPKCARWNLAPLEERWEVIEDAERLFHDTRTRVQRENIGLATLRDGTRLVRVGQALPGELAAWRYANHLVRRRKRYLLMTGAGAAATGVLVGAGVAVGGIGLAGTYVAYMAARGIAATSRTVREALGHKQLLARLSAEETADGEPAVLRRDAIATGRLRAAEGGGIELAFDTWTDVWTMSARVRHRNVVLHGDPAQRVLARAMVHVNAAGASQKELRWAVESLAKAPSPGEYLSRTAGKGVRLSGRFLNPAQKLALEMALHEETERRALEGELAGLEAAWRQAEEIAAIADALPDDVPAPEPPRIILPGSDLVR